MVPLACPPGLTSLAARLRVGVPAAVVVAGLLSACASKGSGPWMTVAPNATTTNRSTVGMLRVDFVDGGHGDAALITSPTGKTVLIDGGPATAGEAVARLMGHEPRRHWTLCCSPSGIPITWEDCHG